MILNTQYTVPQSTVHSTLTPDLNMILKYFFFFFSFFWSEIIKTENKRLLMYICYVHVTYSEKELYIYDLSVKEDAMT